MGSESIQDLGNPFLDLTAKPGIVVPLLKDSDLFYPGAGCILSVGIKIPGLPYLFAYAESGFIHVPIKAETALFILPFGLGADFKLNITPRWRAKAGLSSGYSLGILTTSPFKKDVSLGGNPYLSVKLGSSYFLTPSLSFGFDVSYQNYLGLIHLFSGLLSATYHISARGAGQLEITTIEIEKLFPVLF